MGKFAFSLLLRDISHYFPDCWIISHLLVTKGLLLQFNILAVCLGWLIGDIKCYNYYTTRCSLCTDIICYAWLTDPWRKSVKYIASKMSSIQQLDCKLFYIYLYGSCLFPVEPFYSQIPFQVNHSVFFCHIYSYKKYSSAFPHPPA